MKLTHERLMQIIKEELEHSIQLATFHLADAMTRAGLHVVQGEDTLTIDLGPPFAGTMVEVKVIKVVD